MFSRGEQPGAQGVLPYMSYKGIMWSQRVWFCSHFCLK